MATISVQLSAELKALAEARASAAGCADVAEYLAQLIRGEAASAPEGLSVNSDEELEALLLGRLQGPSVEMTDADFDAIRQRS
jgi:hypothetical protein